MPLEHRVEVRILNLDQEVYNRLNRVVGKRLIRLPVTKKIVGSSPIGLASMKKPIKPIKKTNEKYGRFPKGIKARVKHQKPNP